MKTNKQTNKQETTATVAAADISHYLSLSIFASPCVAHLTFIRTCIDMCVCVCVRPKGSTAAAVGKGSGHTQLTATAIARRRLLLPLRKFFVCILLSGQTAKLA